MNRHIINTPGLVHHSGSLRWPGIFILCAGLVLFSGLIRAQTVVIAENVEQQSEKSRYGMGRLHYRHLYMGFGFAAGSPLQSGAELVNRRSPMLEYGMRYRLQYASFLALGADLGLRRQSWFIRQQAGKRIPDTLAYDKEKLVFVALQGAVYQRIHFGARGDHIGRFADLGVFSQWFFHQRHVTHENTGNQSVRIRRIGLDYAENLSYGLFARIGYQNLALKLQYRLSEAFVSSFDLPEPSPWHISLEIGFHPM